MTAKENRTRKAKLDLVTRTRRMLTNMGSTDRKAIERMARECGCSVETVREWLPEAGRNRRPPKGKNFDLLKKLHHSIAPTAPDSEGKQRKPTTASKPRITPDEKRGSITITFEGDYADRVLEVLARLRSS